MVQPPMGKRYTCGICKKRVRVRWSAYCGGSWVPIMHKTPGALGYCIGHLYKAEEASDDVADV